MHELSFQCNYEDADRLSDKLLSVGACSVIIEDADAGKNIENPIFGEPGITLQCLSWRSNRLSMLVPSNLDPLLVLDYAVIELGIDIVIYDIFLKKVFNIDWVSLVQSSFIPFDITERLSISPVDYDIKFNDFSTKKIVLKINPGMAFGTGSHATTSLCLSWLDLNFLGNGPILDYGCGSGILSIAAMKLGATRSVAVDIDPLAIDATIYNADINNVAVEAKFPYELLGDNFQLVIANILKEPLQILAEELCSRVSPGGSLLLSGILSNQIEEVESTYSKYIKLSVWRVKEDWVCLHGIKM